MHALDALNKRFGRETVTYGVTGREKQGWGMKRDYHSPCFTTRWTDLLRV